LRLAAVLVFLLVRIEFSDLVNPCPHFVDPGVDAWIVLLATADTPRNDPNLFPVIAHGGDEGSATVSTARIFALFASAKHSARDTSGCGAAVSSTAFLIAPDFH